MMNFIQRMHQGASFFTTVAVVGFSAIALWGANSFANSDNANPNAAFNRNVGATTDGTAAIQIAVPLTIKEEKSLNFGQVIRSNNEAGMVKLDRNNNRTGTNVNLSNMAGVASGVFRAFGEQNTNVNFSVDRTVTLRNEKNNELAVTLENDGNTKQLGANGQVDYRIGGEIKIAANQPSGNYVGKYNITVSY